VALLVLKPVGYFLSLTQKKYHSFSPILAFPTEGPSLNLKEKSRIDKSEVDWIV